jgi:UDP-N-acetylmuramate dehydrogenase
VWHSFVLYCVDKGYAGIENLSLIPGTVGASPIQNIGAYGVEVKDVITSVRFYHLEKKKFETYDNATCQFGYRDSIFKQSLKGKIIITAVTFQLNKKAEFHIQYGNIQQELEHSGITTQNLSIKAISDAVIRIRSSKLPDPKLIGNAGSFFKNPIVSQQQYEQLHSAYTTMPHYPLPNNQVKIPAAWLIEQCGWKGYRIGDAGVHEHQALVLVNYGGASGKTIDELSLKIVDSVQEKFNITLEREVQIL